MSVGELNDDIPETSASSQSFHHRNTCSALFSFPSSSKPPHLSNTTLTHNNMSAAAEAQADRVPCLVATHSEASRSHGLYIKKEEWVRRLRQLGEDPPAHWTVPQLQARHEELVTVPVEAPDRELGENLKAMVKASRKKKSEFQDYLIKMGVNFHHTDTVAQLMAKAEQQITERFAVSG